MKDPLPVNFQVCDGKLHTYDLNALNFIAPFSYGEVLILFFEWKAYTSKIRFLTKNVEHFLGIFYGRYTLITPQNDKHFVLNDTP